MVNHITTHTITERPSAPTPTKPSMKSQIGGSHYKDMPIQPLEYSMMNGLNACEHSVVKYVSRHRSKNGKQDLEKAIDMLHKLIEFEYPE
jgi:hypothetical protein